MASKTILEQLAEQAVDFELGNLPAPVIQKAKISLLDALECCIETVQDEKYCGTYDTIIKFPPEIKEDPYGKGTATLLGAKGISDVRGAVFFNVVAGSISARNDIHQEGSSHPGESVVPAALALAEANHKSGKELLEAIVLGYEIMIRLGKSLKSGTAQASASLRRAALPVPVSIAFTAAKVLGFSEKEMCNAAALSCNHLCGLNEWRVCKTGEDVFQNAWAAVNGIFAAELAGNHVPAAWSNLEGEYGLLSVFGARENAGMMADEFGTRFFMLETMNKPVAACLSIQAPCQLAQDLLDDPEFVLEELDTIVVHVASYIMDAAWYGKKDVDNQVSAILSVPYGIAAVLAAGDINRIKWVPPYGERVYELMNKCSLVYDDFSDKNLGAGGFQVTAKMKNGKTVEKMRLDFVPLSDEEVEKRFFSTMARHFDEETANEMLEMVRHMEDLEDVSSFAALFRK